VSLPAAPGESAKLGRNDETDHRINFVGAVLKHSGTDRPAATTVPSCAVYIHFLLVCNPVDAAHCGVVGCGSTPKIQIHRITGKSETAAARNRPFGEDEAT
jgi:hypothetical protein